MVDFTLTNYRGLAFSVGKTVTNIAVFRFGANPLPTLLRKIVEMEIFAMKS
jgi:hypothetical protein